MYQGSPATVCKLGVQAGPSVLPAQDSWTRAMCNPRGFRPHPAHTLNPPPPLFQSFFALSPACNIYTYIYEMWCQKDTPPPAGEEYKEKERYNSSSGKFACPTMDESPANLYHPCSFPLKRVNLHFGTVLTVAHTLIFRGRFESFYASAVPQPIHSSVERDPIGRIKVQQRLRPIPISCIYRCPLGSRKNVRYPSNVHRGDVTDMYCNSHTSEYHTNSPVDGVMCHLG